MRTSERTDKLLMLGERFPGKGDEIQSLHRLLVAYDRLQELLCNGRGWRKGFDVKDYDIDSDEPTPLRKAEERHEAKIKELVKIIDPALQVYFQGDPRGYCVKINAMVDLGDGRLAVDCLSWLFYY